MVFQLFFRFYGNFGNFFLSVRVIRSFLGFRGIMVIGEGKKKKRTIECAKVRLHLKLVMPIVTMELLNVRKKQGYNQMWQKYSQE